MKESVYFDFPAGGSYHQIDYPCAACARARVRATLKEE